MIGWPYNQTHTVHVGGESVRVMDPLHITLSLVSWSTSLVRTIYVYTGIFIGQVLPFPPHAKWYVSGMVRFLYKLKGTYNLNSYQSN